MRASAFCIIALAYLIVGCASAPETAPAIAPPPIAIKEETPQYSFVYEAPADVVAIPGLAHTLKAEAAKAKTRLLADNAGFRKDMPNDPRGVVQLAYEAIWSRAADAGALASVRMDYYGYGGGAHPITDFDGRIFDTATGRRLLLADLLSKPVMQSALPDALCKAVAAAKAERGTPPDIYGDPIKCSGASANVKLDGPVVFIGSTKKGKAAGLRFLFPPYVLGAYVEGPYVADVPASAFIADVKAEYAPGFGGAPAADDPANPDFKE